MRGETRLKLLEFIEETPAFLSDLFFILTLPHGTSINRGWHLLGQRDIKRASRKDEKDKKRRFNDLIYNLRKEELIKDFEQDDKKFIQLTPKGEKKLEGLRLKKAHSLPDTKFEKQKDEAVKIIIFDIPERERRKRAWLRLALSNLEFQMLQRSVWVGKTILPKRFIDNLSQLDLISYVEIFAINKSGSLKRLKL